MWVIWLNCMQPSLVPSKNLFKFILSKFHQNFQYSSISNPTKIPSHTQSWMGDPNEPLSGFSWRSGTKRDTTGIIMWSDIFLHTLETTGEKIAIVIMDTQGLFDNETSPADNSRIFALGTLISSIQILNLVQIVQEDQLQWVIDYFEVKNSFFV